MPTFTVRTRETETLICLYWVEAGSPEEAEEIVRMNEGELEPLLDPQGREFEEILEVEED